MTSGFGMKIREKKTTEAGVGGRKQKKENKKKWATSANHVGRARECRVQYSGLNGTKENTPPISGVQATKYNLSVLN